MVNVDSEKFGGFDAHAVRMSLWDAVGMLSDRYEGMRAGLEPDRPLLPAEFQPIDLYSLSETRSKYDEVNCLISLAKTWATEWNSQIGKHRLVSDQERAYQKIGACILAAYAKKCALDFGQKQVLHYSFFQSYEHKEIPGPVWAIL